MAAAEPDFRDYGLHPDMAAAAAPRDRVRCYLSTARVVGQWLSTLLILAVVFGLAFVFGRFLPSPINVVAVGSWLLPAMIGVRWVLKRSYGSVELDGDRLTLQHLYTRSTVERSVDEIDRITAIAMSGGEASAAITNKMLGRIRAYDVHFRDDKTPLRISRADPAMTNARELLEGIVQRMLRHAELEVEVVPFEGRPYVKSIRRTDRELPAEPSVNRPVYLILAIAAGLLVGPICAFWGAQEEERHRIGSVPPHVITLADLVRNGHGGNRHVTVTNYIPHGYASEEKNGSWTNVTVALYPDDVPLQQQRTIPAVLRIKNIGKEANMIAKLRPGRVTGICSESRRKSWGSTLGPTLVNANEGRELAEAWDIDEMTTAPSATFVSTLYSIAYVGFGLAVLLSTAILFRK